jgi:putative transposase
MDPLDLIEQGKITRYFRATRKLNTPNLISHITQRAAGKDLLFLEDSDYLFMIRLLKEISQHYSLTIYAFSLMPNHTHLLFSPRKENLYDAMRDLFSRYAMRFNKKYERRGHLFGGPYRQALCFDDSYLLAASLYIHLNPVRAGIIADPHRYRWSSCRLYCDQDAPKSFVDPSLILSLLSESDGDSKKQYHLLLDKGSGFENAHVLEQEDAIERFRKKLASLFPSIFSQSDQTRNVATLADIDFLSLQELGQQIESVHTSKYARSPSTRKAKRYLIEQLIARGYKRHEIAEQLKVSPKTVYNILKSPL